MANSLCVLPETFYTNKNVHILFLLQSIIPDAAFCTFAVVVLQTTL